MRSMRTKTTVARSFAAAGLALAFTFGFGWMDAGATDDEDNFFDRHPVPAGARTGVNPHDPYAPLDLGPSLGALRVAGVALGGASSPAEDPCSPVRCPAW